MTWKRDLAMGAAMGAAAQFGLRAADWLWDRAVERFAGDEAETVETESCADCGHTRECTKGATDRASR